MPIKTTVTLSTTKAVASGGIGTAIAIVLGDTELMSLFLIGILASLLSFFYDWAHTKPRIFGVTQIADITKYVFYGVILMFLAFYLGTSKGAEYIEMPRTAWGMVSALIAGSAVSIVDYFVPKLKAVTEKLLGRIR